MELTEDQKRVLLELQDFFSSDDTVFLLKGSAGTGKTTLVQFVIKELNIKVVGIAPTHKAKRVLRQRMKNFPVLTLASFLQKARKLTSLGIKVFDEGTESVITFMKGCYILDEVSMVADDDFRRLMKIARANSNKILAIGDPYQIPAISQAMVERDGVLYRRKSMAFSSKYRNAELVEIVRQARDSPILKVASYVRSNICSDFSLKSTFPEFCIDADETYKMFTKIFAQKKVKIVAYTNEAVEHHNTRVRDAIGFAQKFELGDILMGYENIGWPDYIIENGADYAVDGAERVLNGIGKRLIGWSVRIKDMDTDEARLLFFPDIGDPINKDTFAKLLQLARKVNSANSTKRDYALYRALKDKLFFLNDMYEYPAGSEIFFTEADLKKREPLLFTPIAEARENSGVYENLVMIYGDLIDERIRDSKIADAETFASSFCMFPKDLDYGYAYTAHKSQGSTIDAIFVDEGNFNKIKNRVNREGLVEDKLTEKNQLKYVACTRASEQLFFI